MRSKLPCRISLIAAGSTSIIYCLLLSVNHLSSVVRGRRISAQSRKRRCVGTVTSRARRRNSWFLMIRQANVSRRQNISITKQPGCWMSRFWRQIQQGKHEHIQDANISHIYIIQRMMIDQNGHGIHPTKSSMSGVQKLLKIPSETKFTRIVSYCYQLVHSLSSFMTFYMDPCGLTFCQETLIKSQVGPHGTLGAVMFVPSSTWKATFLLSFFSFLSPLKSWKWTSYIRYASSWLYVEHILIHSSYFLWFNERRDCRRHCL